MEIIIMACDIFMNYFTQQIVCSGCFLVYIVKLILQGSGIEAWVSVWPQWEKVDIKRIWMIRLCNQMLLWN